MSSSWSYYVLYIHPTGLVATAITRPNWYSNAFRTEKNNYPATTILTVIAVICENGTAALFKFSHSFVTWKCPSIFFPVLFICYICDKLKISSCTHKIDLYTILTVHLLLGTAMADKRWREFKWMERPRRPRSVEMLQCEGGVFRSVFMTHLLQTWPGHCKSFRNKIVFSFGVSKSGSPQFKLLLSSVPGVCLHLNNLKLHK